MAESDVKKYRIIFRGEIEPGLDLDVVKKSLAQLFKTTPERIEKLFSGKQVTLNKDLDELSAQSYVTELQSAGAICVIEPMPEITPSIADGTPQSPSDSTSTISDTVASARATVSKGIETLTTVIAPSIFPKLYIAGWILSAFGMCFIFCTYIFIIMFIGSTLFDHIADNTNLIDDLPVIIGFLAYFIPIVIGILIIGALIKPFFAPPIVKRFSLPLSRKKETALFIFIEKLCHSIGQALPSTIEIDFSVNATTSYNRGLVSFLEDELTLTLGLPVVSEFTIEELSSLLAHEFAHFTDKMTMRLYYIITSVNSWFARIVFEQDTVDMKLTIWDETASNSLIRLLVLFLKIFVLLAKNLCRALMFAGHGISRYYVRQMEFEADRYSARLVGSYVCESALLKIHVLNKASKESFQRLKKLKNQNDTSLPDNFIQLISTLHNQMTEDEISAAKGNAIIPKKGLFDSHPTDTERIEKIRSLRAKGTFQSDKPANTLFSNFDEITKIASARFYRESLGLRFNQKDLISTQDFLAIPEPEQTIDIAKPVSKFI